MKPDIQLRPAYGNLAEVRTLFTEYVNMLNVDLSFQSYAQELAGLPGKYSPPQGRLYLAWHGDAAVGTVGLRKFDAQSCEMKRLFVLPEYRGQGIGKALVETIISEAKSEGYSAMLLDTLASLDQAVRLYKKMGFYEIAPFYPNPYPGVLYLKLELRKK